MISCELSVYSFCRCFSALVCLVALVSVRVICGSISKLYRDFSVRLSLLIATNREQRLTMELVWFPFTRGKKRV